MLMDLCDDCRGFMGQGFPKLNCPVCKAKKDYNKEMAQSWKIAQQNPNFFGTTNGITVSTSKSLISEQKNLDSKKS